MIAVNLFNYLESSIQGVFVLGENGFWKYFSVNAGVWLRMENTFFGNAFQFDRVLGVKSFPFLFYLQISFSEKQRERERAHRRRPQAFNVAGELQAPVRRSHAPDRTVLVNHSTAPITPHRSISPSLDLASTRSHLQLRAFDAPIFDPPISLSLCDFDFCCCCGGVVVVFWWLWLLIAGVCCRGLNWSFGGVWCWDLAMICSVNWDLAVILKFSVIKFVWMLRKQLRKCEKFVGKQHFQNRTKHMKIFSTTIFKMQPNT